MSYGQEDTFSKNAWWYIGTIIAIGVLLYVGYQNYKNPTKYLALSPPFSEPQSEIEKKTTGNEFTLENEDYTKGVKDYYPEYNGELVNHTYYTLSYLEKYEQAEWVCYPLSKQILMRPNIPRSDWFNKDPDIKTGSAEHFQYKGSGYTRGHLAPAADMSFDKLAMDECFYMSNMSPQLRNFNNGIWREIEEQTRDWTFQNKEVYIVSGPYFSSNVKFFKKHKIAIPDGFFKVVLDLDGPEKKGVAYFFPHAISDQPLHSYAMTIDELESKLDLNLFAGFNQGLIEPIESSLDLEKWPTSTARFNLRVTRWNYE